LATETLQVKQETRFDGEPVFVCQNLESIIQRPVIAVKPFVYKDLTMNLQPLPSQRFVRRTQLGANEYRKNFHQIDREILSVITSPESDRVTPLMSKVYLRLVNAPERFWEREGVLRIEAERRDEKLLRAWEVLCELISVASATASKALQWMHEQGIIGYFSGKNGVGLRIFLNRAASSIGVRAGSAGKKILAFPHTSSEGSPASANETAFNDSFAVREISDTEVKSGAPKNGAENEMVVKTPSEPFTPPPHVVSVDEIVLRLRSELEPTLRTVARQAAEREHDRTRRWLEERGLPKAARVAQHEAYGILRKLGLITESAKHSSSDVGRSTYTAPEPHRLSPEEIEELAGVCVSMLEVKGQSVKLTLSEMSAEAGGFVLPEDAPRVREVAESMIAANNASRKT
jgi:hypothetical protein